MNSLSPIWSRTLSSFPLSVGTGLALESLFTPTAERIDAEREIPNQIPINKYDELWVNVYTLYRNIMSAIQPADIPAVSPEDIAAAIASEMEVITGLLRNEGGGRTIVRFYVSQYKGLDTKHPRAILRVDSTIGQKSYRALWETAMAYFGKHMPEHKDIKVFKNSVTPDKAYPKAIILTHVPYDLLEHRKFSKLDLLESHTGVLKGYDKFYTKYINGKDLFPLPFNPLLLQIFGDKETFRPMAIKIKKEVLEVATNSRWSPATTDAKIKFDISRLSNHYLSEILTTML